MWFSMYVFCHLALMFVQGRLFPLVVQGILFPLLSVQQAGLALVYSREFVPLDWICSLFVLLASSLFCKLVLHFLIYTILTFDQKKKLASQLERETRERCSLS